VIFSHLLKGDLEQALILVEWKKCHYCSEPQFGVDAAILVYWNLVVHNEILVSMTYSYSDDYG
jgi:hypothetical protein